jgi:predicted GNAT family acetyltransferase
MHGNRGSQVGRSHVWSGEPHDVTVLSHRREDRSRLERRVDDDLAGWLDYRPAGDSIIVAHTEVMEGHEGEGLGGVLVRSALEAARSAGRLCRARTFG